MRVLFPNLVIAVGLTKSNVIDGALLGWMKDITFYPPGTLAGTVTVQVSPKSQGDSVDGDYINYQESGSDVTLTASKARKITNPGSFGSMRLIETVVAGAGGETFGLVGEEEPALIGY